MNDDRGSEKRKEAVFTRRGLRLGARLSIPFVLGTLVPALAVGALSAKKGLGLFDTLAMSALVFGAAAQLAALDIWQNPWTPGGILLVAAVTAIVNFRIALETASLRPHIGRLPGRLVYPSLLTVTDASWLVAIRHFSTGGRDAGVLAGAGLALLGFWVLLTLPGYLLGTLIDDPKTYGLDLVMPAMFIGMIVPMWKGRADLVGWGIAGLVSIATAHLVEGHWYIVAGAIAGSLAGAYAEESRP